MKEIKKQVVIVGGGVAGLLGANALVANGLDCVLLEAGDRQRWGCRFCVDVHSGTILNGVVPSPSPEAIVHAGGGGADVMSAAGRHGFNLSPLPMVSARLWKYQEQLLEAISSRGCEVRFSSRVLSLEPDNGSGPSVIVKRGRSTVRYRCDLVVLATGNEHGFDRGLYAHFGLRRKVLNSEFLEAWQELWTVDPLTAVDLPSPPGVVNYRLGTEGPVSTLMVWVDRERNLASVLAGSLTCDGHKRPARAVADFVEAAPYLVRKVSGGGGAIPVRRPVDMLTARGIALLGHAGCQVYPSTGCGVALAGNAARLLAGPAREYCMDGRRPESLWKYNLAYQRSFGAWQAASEVFINGLRRLDPDSSLMERMLAVGLAGPEDFLRSIEMGHVVPEPLAALGRLPEVVRMGRGLAVVAPVIARAIAVSSLYQRFYPRHPDLHAVRPFIARIEKLCGWP